MSKIRGYWDLGLCTFWIFAKREPLRNAKFEFFLRAKHVFSGKSSLCSGSDCARSDCARSTAASALLHVVCHVWIQFSLTFHVENWKGFAVVDQILLSITKFTEPNGTVNTEVKIETFTGVVGSVSRLVFSVRLVSHGRYRRSVRFNLGENTVDIDGQFNSTY